MGIWGVWLALDPLAAKYPDLSPYVLVVNSTLIFAGSNGMVKTITGTTLGTANKNSGVEGGININQVYFHDDRTGYLACSSGKLYKCKLEKHAWKADAAIDWELLPLHDDFGINASNASSFEITTLHFPSQDKAFMGGFFYNGNPTNHAYARLVHDESMLYSTLFWYDRLGRMVVSRNTKQFNKHAYSYTLYDPLGRISEVGEITEGEKPTMKFAQVFGDYVSNIFNPNTISDLKFAEWIAANERTQVTRTFYDEPLISITGISQDNLRKRVATATYSDVWNADTTRYNHATHYSYDIHGNVKTMWQDNPSFDDIWQNNDLKN